MHTQKPLTNTYDRRGSLFQEHFGRKKITDEHYLRRSVMYIHTNPCKHHVQMDFENYAFSSYRIIVGGGSTYIQRREVLECFGDENNFIESHKNFAYRNYQT